MKGELTLPLFESTEAKGEVISLFVMLDSANGKVTSVFVGLS